MYFNLNYERMCIQGYRHTNLQLVVQQHLTNVKIIT